MKPLKMPHTSRVLGAPKDWDEKRSGPCIGLPITDSEGVMYSWWKATWRQRLQIAIGRPVRLAVIGSAHPPVSLDVLP